MKRLFVLMALMVLVLSLPLSVSADLIYEPRDDFYEQHREECKHVDQKYVANGPDGKLIVYTSPKNPLIQTVLPNRETIYISFVYTSAAGMEWGCVTLWAEDIIGWVPMAYVVPIYNSSDFWNEFEDRIKDEDGIVSTSADQKIYFWEYPGSEDYSTTTVGDPQYAPDYYTTFVDDAGRKWGQTGYYQGIHGGWICLDEPSADYATLYATHPPQQVSKPEIQPEPKPQPVTQPTTQPDTQPTTQPDTQPVTQPTTQPVSKDKVITPSGISPTTILIAAAAVAVVSGGLLVVLKKKKT
jgi:hypothetical protein